MMTEKIECNLQVLKTPPQIKTRAFLFCLGSRENMKPLIHYRPAELLNIADKPILFHVLDSLVKQGIDTFDLILHHFPEQIEEKIDEGSRWGVKINYHLAKNPLHPLIPILPTLKKLGEDLILIGQGDYLPLLPKDFAVRPKPVFFDDENNQWTGWGLISAQDLSTLNRTISFHTIPTSLTSISHVNVGSFLSSLSFSELKDTNKKFLNGDAQALLFPQA